MQTVYVRKKKRNKKKMEKWWYFQQHEKYRYQAFYTSVIVLGVLKEDLGGFSNQRKL